MATINATGNGLTGASGSGNFVGSTSPTITTPRIGQINDANGNAILSLAPQASAVNYLIVGNSAGTSNVALYCDGTATNLGINLTSKGSGTFTFGSTSSTPLVVSSGTAYQHTTGLAFANTSANRTVTFPDADGTVTLLGNSSTGSGNVVLATSPTISQPVIARINDSTSTATLTLLGGALSVNNIEIASAATAGTPQIYAVGSDTNINIGINAKGTGAVILTTTAATNPLLIYSGTGSQHSTSFIFANTAQPRAVTFPDADGTLLMTGQAISTVPSIAFSSTSGVIGTATNDNAAAGSVGEFVSSVNSGGSALTTLTALNVASISLTAGDWDVWGNVLFNPALTTNVVTAVVSINNVSATNPANYLRCSLSYTAAGSAIGDDIAMTAPSRRFSLSATTTIYLVGYAAFSVNILTAYGGIYARRVR